MITFADIEAARERVRDHLVMTPLAHSEYFSQLTGNRISFKLENLQMTGSFKERGAVNRLLTLTPEERARGVITSSAGNHAQAVAYHAARQGVRSVIYMPLTTPLVKVQNTRSHGAEVVLIGENFDDTYDAAVERCRKDNLVFVHAFNDDDVIAGQGTLGLELIEQNPYLDAVVIPIGGGGLIGGTALALKETNPKIKVIGVQTARVPSMKVAIAERKPVRLPGATTIAEGIAVRAAGEKTLPLVEKYVDTIVTVEEEEIANAILLLLEREKTVAEGAGAAGVAALVQRKTGLQGKRVAVVVCGGNIDVNFLSRIIEHGLAKDGRLVRIRVKVSDHPGAVHRLTGVIAEHRANVIEIYHDRAIYGVSPGETAIDFKLETRGPSHIAELLAAFGARGYHVERIT
jgi:threonine dehydratase